MREKHYVFYYGKHGSKKTVELFYLEDHVWERLGNKCPNISELEIENIESTGSTCLKNDVIQLVEIMTCDCDRPHLHLGVEVCSN